MIHCMICSYNVNSVICQEWILSCKLNPVLLWGSIHQDALSGELQTHTHPV